MGGGHPLTYVIPSQCYHFLPNGITTSTVIKIIPTQFSMVLLLLVFFPLMTRFLVSFSWFPDTFWYHRSKGCWFILDECGWNHEQHWALIVKTLCSCCLYEDTKNNEEERIQFGEYQRHVSQQYIQRLIHDNSLVCF